MNAVCVQLDIAWEDAPANCAAVAGLLERADLAPGDLVVLPEMFAVGFSMNAAGVAEPPDGPTAQFLSETARGLGVYLLGGLAVDYEGLFRNEAALFGPDGAIVGRYWKMHPFSPAGEGDHYAAGDEVIVLDLGELHLCPAICYDLRFGEPFRSGAEQGAELFAVIANWPAARADHWSCLLKARAIENQAYVAAVNRCGDDPNHAYAGGSVIIDPQGNALAVAGDDECTILAPLDPDVLRRWREEFPVLRDRR